jgi:hypothetical protein
VADQHLQQSSLNRYRNKTDTEIKETLHSLKFMIIAGIVNTRYHQYEKWFFENVSEIMISSTHKTFDQLTQEVYLR